MRSLVFTGITGELWNCWHMSPTLEHIWLNWYKAVAWEAGFFKVPQVCLMCGQVGEPVPQTWSSQPWMWFSPFFCIKSHHLHPSFSPSDSPCKNKQTKKPHTQHQQKQQKTLPDTLPAPQAAECGRRSPVGPSTAGLSLPAYYFKPSMLSPPQSPPLHSARCSSITLR